MIFQDQSLETIRLSIAKLRQDSISLEDEVQDKLRDFYYGRQFKDEYLANWGFKRKDGKTDIPKGFCNITKKIIDKISLIYKYAPDRYIDENREEGQRDIYEEWISNNPRFNVTLKQAERQTKLLGKVLFRPPWDGFKWKFFIETEYEAHFTKDDTLNPFAYSWPLKQNINSREVGDVKEEKFVWWDAENYFFYDSQGRISYDEFGGVNPYGVIPFIEMMDGICVDQYPATHGAIELVQANEQINVALMNLNMMIHFQAFDQPVARGVDPKDADKIVFGPNKAICLSDPNSNLELLGFNPKIIECYQAIKSQIELIAWTYNLSVDWALEGTPSGFSLLVKNIDLLEAREDDVELATMYEQELYKVISAIQDYHNPPGEKKLPKDKMPTIDFQEINFPVNQKEELDRWDWEIERNASSVVDYIQSKEDLTEEEAIDRFNRNKKLNGKLSWRDKLEEKLNEQKGIIIPNE